jgi:hypothetical protein
MTVVMDFRKGLDVAVRVVILCNFVRPNGAVSAFENLGVFDQDTIPTKFTQSVQGNPGPTSLSDLRRIYRLQRC